MTTVIASFWIIFNCILFIFVSHEVVLVLYALLGKKRESKKSFDPESYPLVAIQLPLYNEKFVVERLLEKVAEIDYPSDRLEIQILDDSTDETTDIITGLLQQDRFKHLQISHVRRTERSGFKAGALQHGMALSQASFFAIFDADFLPDPQFLKQTIPYFEDRNVGVVQTRWTHTNEYFSPLTMAEGVMLDAHFGIEQRGRSRAKGFINFNGTAGIWRRSCIEEAGGWQGDTLTEDLDLSFRAQLKNWRIAYLFHAESPAELPVTFNAYRNQQFRWSKGAAECFRKNSGALWQSRMSLQTKLIGTMHLLNSSVYILVLSLMTLAPLIYFYCTFSSGTTGKWLNFLPYLGISVNLMLIVVLLTGKLICSKQKLKTIIFFVPSVFMFFSISLGISPHMAMAVINGYRGKKSEFVRTPKFGNDVAQLQEKTKLYQQPAQFNLRLIEAILFCYGIFWLSLGIHYADIFTITYGSLIITAFSMALFFPNSTWRKSIAQ